MAGVRVHTIGVGTDGGHGRRDRRLQRGDRARPRAARGGGLDHRRDLPRGRRRRRPGRDLQVDRPALQDRLRAHRGHRAVHRRRGACCSSSARCSRCSGSGGWSDDDVHWPLALLLVLAVPLVLGVYLLALRRRRKQAVRYSSVALVALGAAPPVALAAPPPGGAAARQPRRARPSASARPQMARNVPIGRTSIILALDVSRSMCATDVEPNRIAVAQQAARDFVEDQPAGTRIGLVVFSGFAQLAVPPTTDREALVGAIDGLTTGRGTAIGAAMLEVARRHRRGQPRRQAGRRRDAGTGVGPAPRPPAAQRPGPPASCPTSSCC